MWEDNPRARIHEFGEYLPAGAAGRDGAVWSGNCDRVEAGVALGDCPEDGCTLSTHRRAVYDVLDVAGCDDATFVNQRFDKGLLDGARFVQCTFANISFKGADLRSCVFSACVFEGCYFRETKIRDCHFPATRFIDCEFVRPKIYGGGFAFSRFVRSVLSYDYLELNLPQEPNLCRDLTANLANEPVISAWIKTRGATDSDPYRRRSSP